MSNRPANSRRTNSRGRGRNAGEGSSNSRGGMTGDVTTRKPKFKWSPRTTQIFLELVIGEPEAEDYTIKLPLASGKRRIEEKFYEIVGERVNWEPEMKSKLDYLRRLWHYNNILSKRTGVHVDRTTGQIDMLPTWWDDRCAEFGSNQKYITVLQHKPLPFKDLLDQIYDEHDVEQDDHYSPYMLGVHLQHEENATRNDDDDGGDDDDDDDVVADETEEHVRSSLPPDNSNRRMSNEDLPRLSRSPIHSSREASRHSPYTTNRSSRVQSTTTRRTHKRRVNFEAQIEGRFQRMEESRGQLLDMVRSRQNSKATYGDALAMLESLPVEPMNTFWWEANKLLMNDEDIREGFMKLRSEENKIRYLERLAGVDRYGNPCDLINLRVTSSTSGSGHVRSDGSGYECGGSFGGGSAGGGSVGGGSVGGGSVGGGSVGGGSVGEGSTGDQGCGLGTRDFNNYDPSPYSAGFSPHTSLNFSPNFGAFDSGSLATNFSSFFGVESPRSTGSGSGSAPEMINFFNRSRGDDGKNQ